MFEVVYYHIAAIQPVAGLEKYNYTIMQYRDSIEKIPTGFDIRSEMFAIWSENDLNRRKHWLSKRVCLECSLMPKLHVYTALKDGYYTGTAMLDVLCVITPKIRG